MKTRGLWKPWAALGLALAMSGCPNGGDAGSGMPAVETAIAGFTHTVAIGVDGSLWAWGNNMSGQIGNGASGVSSNRRLPTRVGRAADWVSVSTGGDHTMAVCSDGFLWGWGSNSWGQLGHGGVTAGLNVPTRIGTASNWAATAAGMLNHTVAVRTDGSMWGWGHNRYGQVGVPGTQIHQTPVRIGAETGASWVSVAAGAWHSAAICSDGWLWGWGHNGWGQVGDGGESNVATPVRIGAGTGASWVFVTAGTWHNVAICSDGRLWVWGDNRQGQLGLGHTERTGVPTRLETEAGTTWVSATAGERHNMAVCSDGFLWGWGHNRQGQFGEGVSVLATPTRIGTTENWVSVSTGLDHTVAVRADGSVWAWGGNFSGQLGDGTTDSRGAPVRVR